ncbi:hypothetical protein GCM10009687_71860 [Asanoa iriomotensis]|uniref:LPXTG-motif cell wall-anchored protein n=2 Tax=Asanoa iriomotensis TaxID=234613 RepID=A0ABQ4C151_9ACTN|nr:hypothetical protein Air01nite_26050 [Asanoa iriomotensis]
MKTARRLLAGLAVAGAFVAASALPAAAQAAPNLQLSAYDALVAPDAFISSNVWLGTDDELEGPVSLTVDTSDLNGASIDWSVSGSDWLCSPESATVTRCDRPVGQDETFGVGFYYTVAGKADAEVGTEGSISFAVEVDGATATAKSAVTIAEASDLSTGGLDENGEPPTLNATGEPGGLAKANAPVSNVGKSTVEGARLVISPDYRTAYAGNFSNCTNYEFAFAVCEFDEPLEPGKNYRLSEDIPYSIDKLARTGAVYTTYTDWWVEGDWKLVEKSWIENAGGEPQQGTGERLRLEEVANARRAPQTDVTPYDSFQQVKITVGGDNHVDMAAVGATASGAVGATVTVKPGIDNLGPAYLESPEEMPTKPAVRITVPEGATVVEAPWDCAPFTEGGTWPADEDAWGKAGAREYGCLVWDVFPGNPYEFEFKLKIDQVVENAVGTITAKIDGDPNAANDTAEIVLNSTGDGGGSGGGDGGGLPVTGPQATLIAGAGVLLVGAGAAFVLVRRRRTRFVA